MILNRPSKMLVAWTFCSLACCSSQLPAQQQKQVAEPTAVAEKHFTLKVLPILKSKCLGCHGAVADDLKGEFDVRSRETLLAGGESGEPGLIPGDLDGSSLVQAVKWNGLEMPPKENDRLTAQQVAAVERWVAAGAIWPGAYCEQEDCARLCCSCEAAAGHCAPAGCAVALLLEALA